MGKGQRLYEGNDTFFSMFQLEKKNRTLRQFIKHVKGLVDMDEDGVGEFIEENEKFQMEIMLKDGRYIKITKVLIKYGHILLNFHDVTEINKNNLLLLEQNKELEKANMLLDKMARDTKELAIARAKGKIAQNVHDILRYHPQDVEIYAVDNGGGCKEIKKSYDLSGIEKRFTELDGSISFSSDGESGFIIHGKLPRK